MEEGFLKTDIWSTLQKRINPALIPTDMGIVEENIDLPFRGRMEQETATSFGQVNEKRINNGHIK